MENKYKNFKGIYKKKEWWDVKGGCLECSSSFMIKMSTFFIALN